MALVKFEMLFGAEPESECPVCGATGEYELLAERVRAIEAAWLLAGGYPDTSTERAAIHQAIEAAVAAIGMEAV